MYNNELIISNTNYYETVTTTSTEELMWEAIRLSKASKILFGDDDNGPAVFLSYDIIKELETHVLCELGKRYIEETNLI